MRASPEVYQNEIRLMNMGEKKLTKEYENCTWQYRVKLARSHGRGEENELMGAQRVTTRTRQHQLNVFIHCSTKHVAFLCKTKVTK